MRSFGRDLRYGLRMVIKRPGTSALAVVALALGIGLTTTMFSIVDGVFLRGLPFDRADALFYLASIESARPDQDHWVLPADFFDWRAAQHSFEDLGAFLDQPVNLASADALPERLQGARLTANVLPLLRVRPVAGRGLTEADTRPGAPPVALISDEVWRDRFARAPDVVGRTIRLDGEPTTIVGIMPPDFGFPEVASVWRPLSIATPAARADGSRIEVLGRLKPGVGAAAAQAELTGIGRELAAAYPEDRGHTILARPLLRQFLSDGAITALTTMLVAVFGVLLIACVNVTNLQLARAAERVREVAVRLAIGASRLQIARQMLVEGLVLSVAGAAVGLGLAAAALRLFNHAIADTTPPFWITIGLDGRVAAVTVVLTALSAVASSLMPAWRVARQSVGDVLKSESRGSTGLRIGRLSRLLVVAELTLSCALLVASGTPIKAIAAFSTIHYPFRTDLFVGRLTLDARRYPDADRQGLAIDQMTTRLSAIPGLRQVTVGSDVPGGGGSSTALVVNTPFQPPPAGRPLVRRIAVAPNYFEVLGVTPVAGRLLAPSDAAGADPVAVIGQDLARRYFPRGDALGSRIRLGRDPAPGQPPTWITVVGIVPSLAVMLPPGTPTETVYQPLAQWPSRDLVLLASTVGPPLALAPDIRRAVAEADPDQPLFQENTLGAGYALQNWSFRVFGGLFMTFGLSALVLAGAGLYGVTAFGVRQRRPEIGVRLALGADRGRIVRMVVGQGIWQVAVGLVVGLGVGGVLATGLGELLRGLEPWDPTILGVTGGVLALTGLLACLVPALRAASIDPLSALRQD